MAAPVMPEEVPFQAPDPLLMPWMAATLAEEARQRYYVARGVDDVISFCETAIAKLREAASTLLRDPGDAAENIYDYVFGLLHPGLDPPLLGPAASLVDAMFNGPGPLAGAIAVAGDLVTKTFYFPRPDGGPLQAALGDLGYLIHVPHSNAGYLFIAYAANLGVGLPGEDTWQRWVFNQNQDRFRATVALERLHAAVRTSLLADIALRRCQGEWEERLPPRERMEAAELFLQQTIWEVDGALAELRAMGDNLVELEQIVIIATGEAPPPP